MDLVSRLKEYMEYSQIAISQFADTCNIPRPTISQILNGRNKKISDELIGKIHAAFPDLSILWLMFGEGQMHNNSNIQISEAQKHNKLTFDVSQMPDHKLFPAQHDPFSEITDLYSKKNDTGDIHEAGTGTVTESSPQNRTVNNIAEALSDKIEPSKKITSIVVFYADNTFQTFNPS